jgi:hypothetical protein
VIHQAFTNILKSSSTGSTVETSLAEVAKVILKAIMSNLENSSSDFRYLVGDGAFKLIDLENIHSDKEFRITWTKRKK